MAENISRKELLKGDDEFISASSSFIRKAQANPKQVTMIVLIAVAAFAAVLLFMNYQNFKRTKSHTLYMNAHRTYENAAAQSDVTSEQWDAILSEFRTLAADYPSLPAGQMSLLYAGHVLYKKQDFKGALEQYEKARNTGLMKHGLEQLAIYHIAMTKFALDEYDEALKLLNDLQVNTSSPYRREALASKARIYEAMGKNKEAVQDYKQYLKFFPEAPDALFIKSRIAHLSAQS